MQLCFSRPVESGHYKLVDYSFIIWALGTHSYSLDSLRHTGAPLDKSDTNPSVLWQTDPKMLTTLSDDSATNQVNLSWSRPDPNTVFMCISASGPQLTSRTWLGIGFVKPLGIGSGQYITDVSQNCLPDNNERVGCLSTIGVLFTIVFTYMGFVLLASATLWNASIGEKIVKFREKWKEIRESR